MRSIRFLILDDDERRGVQHLKDALATRHELEWTTNIRDALRLLDQTHFDSIICGTHLVHESMFDFLKQVRTKAALQNIPFLCFRVNGSPFANSVDESLEITARRLGANAYIVVPDTSDPVTLEAIIMEKIKIFVDEHGVKN